jgi:hypothetical protein
VRGLREPRQLAFDSIESILDVGQLWRARHAESRVMPPPVEADLLRLVDRANEQPDLDRDQLDVGEVDLDVAGDDEAFVQHTVEDIDQAVRPRRIYQFRQSMAPFGFESSGIIRQRGSAQPPQRSEVDVEILVRETEDRLQLIHAAAQFQ